MLGKTRALVPLALYFMFSPNYESVYRSKLSMISPMIYNSKIKKIDG
jgi:hypothetical protein